MTPHSRSAALLAAAAPCLLACLLAAPPAAAAQGDHPAPQGGSHAVHRPVDKVHPVQPPPGRLAQGGPVQRAVPRTPSR
ncbi:hypothetical protein [Kitasatospora phosalacinea]|uniref:hypothetical protein n=1 Tax=Kitasatospora phosalacinea TaxID=2065 RepID=UPI0005245F10|nr:hypothetical protein [Kitasatospora phosalacinea]